MFHGWKCLVSGSVSGQEISWDGLVSEQNFFKNFQDGLVQCAMKGELAKIQMKYKDIPSGYCNSFVFKAENK